MKSKESLNTYNINIPDPAPACTLTPPTPSPAPGLGHLQEGSPRALDQAQLHPQPRPPLPQAGDSQSPPTPGGVVRARDRLSAGATTGGHHTPLAASVPAASNLVPHPWASPGKNTGVGCHFLLQCMQVESESEVAQSCPTPSDPMDWSLSGSSIHGIFQARVLEWVAIVFSVS